METVWLGRQNAIEMVLRADGVPFNAPNPLNSANKLRLLCTNDQTEVETALDSVGTPALFSTSTIRQVDGQNVRVVTLLLGASALVAGEYDCVLTVYDATYTTGLVVGEFKLSVRPA